MKHEISRRAMVGSVMAAGAAGTVGWFRGWDAEDPASRAPGDAEGTRELKGSL